ENIPASPEILTTDTGIRIGVWIMPNNEAKGMFETFLNSIVPGDEESQKLLSYTNSVVAKSRDHGADFKDDHIDKAKIYTWLALKNPPGTSYHLALQKRILDPTSPSAEAFVKWFCELFELELSGS
ncbi:MAG: DUF3226 domain-containing protein, partial [Verrucomicrobiota bacterium]